MNLSAKSYTALQTTETPVKQAIIMVCEKCGQKLMPTGGESDALNPALAFQQQMKSEIKQRFGKGVVRAVSSSCLDVCPQGRVTVGIVNADSKNETAKLEFFTVAPEDLTTAKEELLARFASI
jgi:hypothetical protein